MSPIHIAEVRSLPGLNKDSWSDMLFIRHILLLTAFSLIIIRYKAGQKVVRMYSVTMRTFLYPFIRIQNCQSSCMCPYLHLSIQLDYIPNTHTHIARNTFQINVDISYNNARRKTKLGELSFVKEAPQLCYQEGHLQCRPASGWYTQVVCWIQVGSIYLVWVSLPENCFALIEPDICHRQRQQEDHHI